MLSTGLTKLPGCKDGGFHSCLAFCSSKAPLLSKEHNMYQVWDGDLFLFNVETADEAFEQSEAGFQIELAEYYGA